MVNYRSFIGALAIGMTLAVSAAAQTPSGKTVVKVGAIGRPDQAAFEIALRRGYFDRQGLEIQTVAAGSGQEFAAALATNQLQVASNVPNAALFNALNRGIDIRIVADYAHIGDATDRTVSIMVRADLIDSGTVKTAADLKGRFVAAGPQLGQYPDLLIEKTLQLGGLTTTDVTMRHLPFTDALAAMATKNLDAGFIIEPLVTQADQQNIARVLLPAGAVDPGAVLSILEYSAEFAKQTEAATKFMVAYLEGQRDYYDAFFLGKDREAALEIVTKYLPMKDPKLWATSRQATDLNGRVNVADLNRQAAFFKKQGTLSGPIPEIEKFVDPQFAEAAVKILGVR
jgi:NitT/TauT family transport system substrate-binding protein